MNKDERKSKTQWDLRQAKLELIGQLTQEKTLAYRDLIKDKSKENLRNFFQEFQVVYKEVKQFANPNNDDQKQLIEEIDQLIEELDEKLGERPGIDDYIELESQVRTFKKLDKADDKLRQLQMEVGLDIPLEVEKEGYGQKDKTKEQGEKQ
jgi:hypothetical protein